MNSPRQTDDMNEGIGLSIEGDGLGAEAVGVAVTDEDDFPLGQACNMSGETGCESCQ